MQEQQKLIVVCKDELFTNQLKKYVETNDDIDSENIVGTKDGAVKIIAWNEKEWLDNKKAGNVDGKVLLIGNIKGADKLLPFIDIKYNAFGIVYGWSGNQAMLFVDPKVLKKKEDYNVFFEELKKTAIPEYYQQQVGSENNQPEAKLATEKKPYKQEISNRKRKKGKNIPVEDVALFGLIAAATFIAPVGVAVGVGSSVLATNIVDYYDNKKMIKKQQYFYGLTKLYENHLAEFLQQL